MRWWMDIVGYRLDIQWYMCIRNIKYMKDIVRIAWVKTARPWVAGNTAVSLKTLKVRWDHLPSVGMTKNLAVQPHTPSVAQMYCWLKNPDMPREFLSSGTVPKVTPIPTPQENLASGCHCALRHPLRATPWPALQIALAATCTANGQVFTSLSRP